MTDTGHEKNTKPFVTYSHPAANCQPANALYWAWAHMTEVLPQYHKDCQDAKAVYQLHLIKCKVCQEGLNGGTK